ncbi:hypothetical protein PENFLA_c017G10225 [Penicillium flavigenum]|uniref:Uncharacterized protein n=1 Tax=Penicillium flavigenum TaxID=254877 RepID=A0A1V6T1Y0_9EURO|nr:hypothetical protein PENFLA_c017G10225 [Penicillium flavigenum]
MERPENVDESEWQEKLSGPYVKAPKLSLRFPTTGHHITTILIHRPFMELITECDECSDKRLRTGSPFPFPLCSRAPGHFGGTCGNCQLAIGTAANPIGLDEDDPIIIND